MTKFSDFITITESKQHINALDAAKTLADRLDGHAKTRYVDALELFKSGIEAGAIWNADYKDAYTYGLNRGMEKAFQDEYYKVMRARRDAGKDNEALNDVDPYLAVPKIAKNHKILSKHKSDYPTLFKIVDAVKGLPEANKHLKTIIQKGRKPNPNADPNKFIKPMAGAEAKKAARAVIQAAADQFSRKFIEDGVRRGESMYHRVKDAKHVKELPKDPMALDIAGRLFTRTAGGSLSPLRTRGWADIEPKIRRDYEDVVTNFVEKNVEKTALIFAKKSGVKSHKLLKSRFTGTNVDNTVHVVFDDDSEFTLNSQVIYKYTRSGKPFTQFPTKFANVKLADGSRMVRPSEEKMLKEF